MGEAEERGLKAEILLSAPPSCKTASTKRWWSSGVQRRRGLGSAAAEEEEDMRRLLTSPGRFVPDNNPSHRDVSTLTTPCHWSSSLISDAAIAAIPWASKRLRWWWWYIISCSNHIPKQNSWSWASIQHSSFRHPSQFGWFFFLHQN